MRINSINTTNFNGHKEARKFRKETKNLLRDIKNMESPSEYTSTSDGKKSIRIRILNVFDKTVPTVGKKYATEGDKKLLDELKQQYVRLEEQEDLYESNWGACGKYIDRSKETRYWNF